VLDSAGGPVYLPRMSAFSERHRVQAAIPLQPCLPRRALTPPSGRDWVHEIKHDGFRILSQRQGDRIRLLTRNGYDFTSRFPKVVAAVGALPVRSCVVDGEVIVVDHDGLSVFNSSAIASMTMPPCSALSTYSNLTAMISTIGRSRTARVSLAIFLTVPVMA
jgi:ATP dependent DNA ligase domain